MSKDDAIRMIDEGEKHLKFMRQLCQTQMNAGRFFVHEHPATAVSWKEKDILRLAAQAGVHISKADQCRYGLKTKGKNGEMVPALKPTKFMTNSEPMSRLLTKRCQHKHIHQPLEGNRCAAAAFYPIPLIRTLIRGMALQKQLSVRSKAPKHQVYAVDGSDDKNVPMSSSIRKMTGGHIEIEYDEANFRKGV